MAAPTLVPPAVASQLVGTAKALEDALDRIDEEVIRGTDIKAMKDAVTSLRGFLQTLLGDILYESNSRQVIKEKLGFIGACEIDCDDNDLSEGAGMLEMVKLRRRLLGLTTQNVGVDADLRKEEASESYSGQND